MQVTYNVQRPERPMPGKLVEMYGEDWALELPDSEVLTEEDVEHLKVIDFMGKTFVDIEALHGGRTARKNVGMSKY